MYHLKGENISFHLSNNNRPILNNLNFLIEAGKICVFLGKSGSGKTTLLKCLAGIYRPSNGIIDYGGIRHDVLKKNERVKVVGYVSQHYQLFPHLSIMENCVQPQKLVLNRTKLAAERVTIELLEKLKISNLKDRYPSELSGGQQQRVAIIRALCMGSKTLLLDEPTSALDPESTKELIDLLKELKLSGYTIALTTHDMTFAKAVVDHLYLMEQGRIVESHTYQKIPRESRSYRLINSDWN